MSNEIIYPMTLSYVKEWGAWEIVRELMTNALDVDENATVKINDKGALVVRSKGQPLGIHHLLFGVSEKPGTDAIGQFGEGMKLALLVLTRLGLTAHVYSGGQHIWNEPAEMAGQQVFKIAWRDGFRDTGETVIGIPDWDGEAFEDRFLCEGDSRIAYTDQFGRSILEQDVPDIFVKRVWVQKATGYGNHYAFGYDLRGVEMNRDRRAVDNWRVNLEIGRLWATVTDAELLERFWQAVKNGAGEHSCNMQGVQIADPAKMKSAFQSVFGRDAVLGTNPDATREATYRGALVVSSSTVGHDLASIVSQLVGTDTEHIQQLEGASRVLVPDRKLSEHSLGVLRILRRLATRISFTGKIQAYILPEGEAGGSYRGDVCISLPKLSTLQTAIEIWLHETAHAEYETADSTSKHVDAVAAVAARLIVSYATR